MKLGHLLRSLVPFHVPYLFYNYFKRSSRVTAMTVLRTAHFPLFSGWKWCWPTSRRSQLAQLKFLCVTRGGACYGRIRNALLLQPYIWHSFRCWIKVNAKIDTELLQIVQFINLYQFVRSVCLLSIISVYIGSTSLVCRVNRRCVCAAKFILLIMRSQINMGC